MGIRRYLVHRSCLLNDQEQQRVGESHEFEYLAILSLANPPTHLTVPGSGVPGEKDGHIMMGRVEVTLGIDALLPLAEAGQCLLCMVNYFQSLLEKEEGEIGMGEISVVRAHHIRPQKQPSEKSSGWVLPRHLARIWGGQRTPLGHCPALNTIISMTFTKRT